MASSFSLNKEPELPIKSHLTALYCLLKNMVLITSGTSADGHRRGWNPNGTIRSNQSEKRDGQFNFLVFYYVFIFLHDCWEK